MRKSRHDELRDTIARDWQGVLETGRKPPVLSMNCECGASTSTLPSEGVTIKTEYSWRGKRPDIAILNGDNVPVGFAEVIDKGPPSKDLLATYQQAGISAVFIPYSAARSILAFCSVRCWTERNAVKRSVGCSDCGRGLSKWEGN